uniref:Lipoprotein n=1 Tax=Desulfobacca acetoxidans TaxID=60893 RepID=A0A7C3Z280_9BACT
MKKFLQRAVAILSLCLCLYGCIAAAAAYGVSRHRTHQSYREYVANMEEANRKRRDQGLEPLPIASFSEWKKGGKVSGKLEERETPAPSPGE